jgi:Ca-activated chloride channel family protein
MKQTRRYSALLLILTTSLLKSGVAQEPTTSSTTAPARITFGMIVTDGANKALDKVSPEQIEVIQNKVKQKVVGLEVDQRPIDIALVLDCSGSFKKLLNSSLEAATLVIDYLRDTDALFIESFVASDRILKIQDFTSNKDTLHQSLKTIYVEGGQSAVIDAIHVATTYLAKHRAGESRRKALVVITDGEDRSSYYSKDDLVKLLRTTDVQVFTLAITLELDREAGIIRRSPREKAESLLKTVAQESGGRVFFLKDKHDLIEATVEVIHDLRGQFQVTFEASNLEPKKSYHKFSVKLTSAKDEKREAVVRPVFYFDPTKTQSKATQ